MDYYEAVAAQPARLEASAQAVEAGLADLDLEPWRQGQLGIVSMGASSHAANALVHRLARHGRRAVNIDASDVLDLGVSGVSGVSGDSGNAGGRADCYLLVTEGGRSRETIEAARLLAPAPRLALTNVPDAPIAEVVDAVVGLGHGPDSKVYTVGYTAALQAFGLLADALGPRDDAARSAWAALPGQVSATLERLAPAASAAAALLGPVGSIDFVGSGASRASVAEAALLLRESTRTTTAAFDTYQYLHGPMECLTPQHGVVLFGGDREVELAHYLAGRGIPTALVTWTAGGASGSAGPDQLVVLEIPDAPEGPLGVLQILPPQLIAGLLARERGLGIDGFLYHQDDTKIGQPALS